MRDTVLDEVLALRNLSLPELRQKYLELFPDDEGIRANKYCLQRRIAYRLQELAYGGLSEVAQSQLQKLASKFQRNMPDAQSPAMSSERASTAVKRIECHRTFLPGTILKKVYKGQILQVRVAEKGFEYQGTTYRSLSAIACVVTGAHWNGRLFFGL
jgi:Protein of unknown function (DUF2924)